MNEWRFSDEEAAELYDSGALKVSEAIIIFAMRIPDDASTRNDLIDKLKGAIDRILKALSIERSPSPLPYVYLANAYSMLGLLQPQANPGEATPEAKQLFKSSLALSKQAIDLYSSATGWDRGSRHDFHTLAAIAAMYLDDLDTAGAQVAEALTYYEKSSMMENIRKPLENTLNKINGARASSGDADSSLDKFYKGKKKKTGWVNGVLIIVIIILLIIAARSCLSGNF